MSEFTQPEHVRLTTNESGNPSAEKLRQTTDANLRIETIGAMREWLQTVPPLTPNNPFRTQEQASTISAALNAWTDAERIYSRSKLKPGDSALTVNTKDVKREQARQKLHRAADNFDALAQKKGSIHTVSLLQNDTSSILNARIFSLSTASHNIRNAVACIQTANEICGKTAYDPSSVATFNENLGALKRVIDSGINMLAEKYSSEPLPASEIAGIFDRQLATLKKQGISVHFNDQTREHPGVQVEWNRGWATSLAQNIVQNTIRARDRQLAAGQVSEYAVTAGIEIQRPPNEQEKLVITIDDNGPGFDQKIVEHGFLYNQSGGDPSAEGERIGMASEVDGIRKYGGDVVPSNITDAEGKVTGARQIITLPLSPTTT